MIKIIVRRLVPEKMIISLRRFVYSKKFSKKIESNRKKNGYCIVFIATPAHGNLGDQAIVYAQERFFIDRGLGRNIVEVSSPDYLNNFLEIKKHIRNNDLIVIDGGGSMGTLWLNEEHKMQHIIKHFPDNRIFIFPQTIFYSDDAYGKAELHQSTEVYSAHTKLCICAREKASFDMMKKIYPTLKVLLVPDMVFYLRDITFNFTRQGAILCLRTDKEKQLSKEVVEDTSRYLELRGLEIRNEPTVICETVTKQNRAEKLQNKWESFSSAEIVVTDRLHGMLFAVITGTPCLAFDNTSRKVSSSYEWIKNLPYIKFVNDYKNIKHDIDDLLNCANMQYNNTELIPYYDKFFDVIKSALHSS